jgi:hypothetical protein
LLDLEGLAVDQVEIDDDGARVVYVETADETASACPSCGAFSLSVKRRVSSRPLNIPYGATVLRLVRHKRRWRYVHRGCARGSFTETVTAVPARALHADAYADRGRRHRIAEQYRPRTPVPGLRRGDPPGHLLHG